MSALANKHIILGITGGIAAYKSADIARRLRDAGAKVRVVMTQAGKEFITPLTMQAVSGHPVAEDLLDPQAEAAMGHIELARWADLVLIAPATANFIAELVHGQAKDLLTTLCLATPAKKVIAPAMNQQMWADAATKANIKTLKEREIAILGPAIGSQACGDVGPGRMLEATDIVNSLASFFETQLLSGTKVLITAGPTHEAIDPVRFISNKSSGKMGYALAQAAVESGAEVTLVSGPVHLPEPERVKVIHVKSAQDMYDAVMAEALEHDIFIAAAAVSDYRVKNSSAEKIKKTNKHISLELTHNPDILTEVANVKQKRPFVVGFAAETTKLHHHAKQKLQQKRLDMIVANEVGQADRGFDTDNNAAVVIWDGDEKEFPLMSKQQLARELIIIIAKHYETKHPTKNS